MLLTSEAVNEVVGINEFMVYRMVITEAGVNVEKELSNEIYVGHQWEIHVFSSAPLFLSGDENAWTGGISVNSSFSFFLLVEITNQFLRGRGSYACL